MVKGRKVKVAMLNGFTDMGGHHFLDNETDAIRAWVTKQTAVIKEHLDGAGRAQADLAVLPELFNQPEVQYGGTKLDGTLRSAVCPFPETLDGPTIAWVKKAAMRWRMNGRM